MSFSKETKAEICKMQPQNDAQCKARLYGMLLFAREFSVHTIVLNTESVSVAHCFSDLLASYAGVMVDTAVNMTHRGGEGKMYSVSVPNPSECEIIFEQYGHRSKEISLRINRANIEDDDCVPYFLSGVFLACGSVNNPQKDYHFEMVVSYRNLATDLCCLMGEISEIHTRPRITNRKGSFVVYVKGSDTIEDLLTYIGAPMSALSVMQSQMVKSVRNTVNRKINSETANSNKTAAAAARQLAAIELISKRYGLASLPDDLREIAQMRLDNPEFNLRELGNSFTPPLSRSGVNHRLQRLMEIAAELKESNNT